MKCAKMVLGSILSWTASGSHRAAKLEVDRKKMIWHASKLFPSFFAYHSRSWSVSLLIEKKL